MISIITSLLQNIHSTVPRCGFVAVCGVLCCPYALQHVSIDISVRVTDNNNNNNDFISIALFHAKHAQLR